MKYTKSEQLFKEAEKYIPGGVNSPVRAFKSVGLAPIFADKAHGDRLIDVDGNEYIDYICSWGPLMLGHSPDFMSEGLEEMAKRGTSYGVATPIEIDVAKIIVDAYPAIDPNITIKRTAVAVINNVFPNALGNSILTHAFT